MNNHPGCFGIAVCFDASPICQSCKSRSDCKTEAIIDLEELKNEVDVGRLMKRVAGRVIKKSPSAKAAPRSSEEKRPLDSMQLQLVNSMPVKPAEVVRQLFRQGIDLRSELSEGRNPYEHSRPIYMRHVCNLLLKERGFSKQGLKQYLHSQNTELTEKSIESQVSIACRVVEALKLARLTDGRYIGDFA